jgi:hypothetical protein
MLVIKSSWIFSQIIGNEPLGAGVNPTKFGVNGPTPSMFAKKRFCEIAIFAKRRFTEKNNNNLNFYKQCAIFSQIRDDLPLGAVANPTKFVLNRRCSIFLRSRKCDFSRNSNFREMTISVQKINIDELELE